MNFKKLFATMMATAALATAAPAQATKTKAAGAAPAGAAVEKEASGSFDQKRFDALRASEGAAVAVSDEELLAAVGEIGAAEGLFVAPEGAACVPALRKLLERGEVGRDERVVLFNTGAGVKYLESFGGGSG